MIQRLKEYKLDGIQQGFKCLDEFLNLAEMFSCEKGNIKIHDYRNNKVYFLEEKEWLINYHFFWLANQWLDSCDWFKQINDLMFKYFPNPDIKCNNLHKNSILTINMLSSLFRKNENIITETIDLCIREYNLSKEHRNLVVIIFSILLEHDVLNIDQYKQISLVNKQLSQDIKFLSFNSPFFPFPELNKNVLFDTQQLLNNLLSLMAKVQETPKFNHYCYNCIITSCFPVYYYDEYHILFDSEYSRNPCQKIDV